MRPTSAPTKRPPTKGSVVRLADLTPAQRQLVLALIAARHAVEASSAHAATSEVAHRPEQALP